MKTPPPPSIFPLHTKHVLQFVPDELLVHKSHKVPPDKWLEAPAPFHLVIPPHPEQLHCFFPPAVK